MTSCKSEEEKAKEVAQQRVNDFLVAVSQNDTIAIDSIYSAYLRLHKYNDEVNPDKLELKSIDYYDLSLVPQNDSIEYSIESLDSIMNWTKNAKVIYDMFGRGKYCELIYSGERNCRFVVQINDDKITLHSFGFFKNKNNTIESSIDGGPNAISSKWKIEALNSDEATAAVMISANSALMNFLLWLNEGIIGNGKLSTINDLCPSTSRIENYSIPDFMVYSMDYNIESDNEGLFSIAFMLYDSLRIASKTYKLYFDTKDFVISKAFDGSIYLPSNYGFVNEVKAYASEGFLYFKDELDEINSRSVVSISENYFEGKTDAEIRSYLNDSKRRIEEMDRLKEEEARKSAARAKYEKVGLVITDVDVSHGTNRYGESTTGLKFEIFNPTKKTIKYVIAIVQGINKFDDPVTQTTRLRGMGPVEPHSSGSWDFSDAFDDKNGIIDDLRGSFQVIYTDGSSRTVSLSAGYADSNFSPSLWR